MWKSRTVWGIWLAAALALYLFSDGYGAPVILAASIAAPVLAVVQNRFFGGKITISLHAEQTCAKREQIEGWMEAENRSLIPCAQVKCVIRCENTMTGEAQETELRFSLAGRSRERIPFSFKSSLCGQVRISVVSAAAGDLFGLDARRFLTEAHCRVIVYPDTFAPVLSVGNRLSFHLEGTEYSNEKAGSDPSEVFAIREYKPGDSPKSIHWKLSEKLERMMVRDPGLPLETSYMLLFETAFPEEEKRPLPGVCDCLAEVFCSVAQAMAAEGISFCVGWKDIRNGLFTQIRIQAEEDLIPVIPQVLSAGTAQEPVSSMEQYLESTDNGYAQVLYFAPAIPAGISQLIRHAGGVSLFLCSDREWPEELYGENVSVTAFSEENYEQELGCIVL